MKIVIKLGGAALENKDTLHKCARAIVELAEDGHKVTVVHGGGAALTRTLKLWARRAISSTACASPTLKPATSR